MTDNPDTNDMRPAIAVYTLALDEEGHAERFMETCDKADCVVVADTGSSDRTAEILTQRGARVFPISVKPWRFDRARNAALALVPAGVDICVSLDLDEVLLPGWREALDESFAADVSRYRYDYVWKYADDGSPEIVYRHDKIHARNGYLWEFPIHESLRWVGEGEEQFAETVLRIGHLPDPAKSRGSYLHLLALATHERPEQDRMALWYGRELFFHGRHEQAIAELERYLSLPSAVWDAERSQAVLYIGLSHSALGRHEEALNALIRSTLECHRREVWLVLAQEYYRRQAWDLCYLAAARCLSITTPTGTYLDTPEAWGFVPHDLAAIAAFNLDMKKQAIQHGETALAHAPSDERLLGNLALYRKS
jgi:tetratricopeptide (TPR) repeat protein